MKKFAALALLATAAAAASAQSSVTLFGVVDIAARNVKNGSNSVQSLASGGINTSRFGFRGTEDLGGGLLAGFWLEAGFNADSGTQSDTTRFFNRRSTASLIGSFGEVRLGRDFTPTYTGWSDFDVFGDNGVAAGGKFNSKVGTNADTLTRADNQVVYFLPSMGGVYGSVAVAAGEGTAGKKYVGGRVGYAAGPVNVSGSLGQTSVTAVGGEDKLKIYTLGASYDLGVTKLSGYYTQNKFGNLKTTVYNLGASVPVTPLASLRFDVARLNASGTGIAANDATQIAFGGLYSLSKRTALYATVARVNNKGAATYVVDSNPVAVAGGKSTGYELGLRHAF
ncbi:MAG: porin [Burkholderiales bacterium PBB5]|nr:MAG: porin [Burkholderiales bacterium PBB5]